MIKNSRRFCDVCKTNNVQGLRRFQNQGFFKYMDQKFKFDSKKWAQYPSIKVQIGSIRVELQISTLFEVNLTLSNPFLYPETPTWPENRVSLKKFITCTSNSISPSIKVVYGRISSGLSQICHWFTFHTLEINVTRFSFLFFPGHMDKWSLNIIVDHLKRKDSFISILTISCNGILFPKLFWPTVRKKML